MKQQCAMEQLIRGYRANDPYAEKSATAWDVVQYERDVLGNDITIDETAIDDLKTARDRKSVV